LRAQDFVLRDIPLPLIPQFRGVYMRSGFPSVDLHFFSGFFHFSSGRSELWILLKKFFSRFLI